MGMRTWCWACALGCAWLLACDGDRGTRDAGGDSGPAPADATAGDSSPMEDGGPPVQCTATRLLVTTSDFATTAGLGALALDGSAPVLASEALSDQDSVPIRLGCRGALLGRSVGLLSLQSPDDPLLTATTIDLDPEGSMPWGANPVAAAAASETKVYVVVQGHDEVVVLDPTRDAGSAIRSRIDLSSMARPGDMDGKVDASDVVVAGSRAYVALGHYWFDAMWAIHFEGSELAVIDVATNALVDMDSATDGVQGIALAGNNPWRGMWLDVAANELWVASTGDSFALDGAIERVDLTAGTVTGQVATEADLGAEINAFAVAGPHWLVVLAGTDVVAFDPAATTITPTTIASGIDGMLVNAGVVYTWTREGDSAGVRAFDAATGAETTGGDPWAFGALPVSGMVAVP